MKRDFATRVLFLLVVISFALAGVPAAAAAPAAPMATTIFSEAMWDGTGNPSNGAAISTFETNNYFQNDALTMSGTGDMRNTSTSSGYTTASGTWNVMLNAAAEYFQIADINTTGYANLVLSFGVRKNTNAEDGSGLTVAVSSDGTNWTNLTVPALPTGSGTATWHYRTASGTIPATANLRIRFTSSNTVEWRIDDVLLVGDLAGDNPPTVSSTDPTNGAPNVPVNSTIQIDFSEAVDLTANAVTLECPVGTPKAFSGLPASNVTSMTLTPSAALPYNTTCTVTVVADQVSDVDTNDPPDNMAEDYSWDFTTVSAPLANDIRISQVYGGGGNSGTTYTHDFIELFNGGTSAINITDWSVQYTSATGTSWQKTDLTGTIQPGAYYLIQQAQGAGGTTPLPTPDASGSIPMSATAGKVALVNNTTALSGSCPTGASIIDFVGFGSTANCYEGTGPTPAPSNTTAVLRAGNGCTDTDDNAADFTAGAPNPRNSSSPVNLCAPVDTPPTVTSTVPANGAYGVAVNAPVSVTFSENVTFMGPVSIVCTSGTPTMMTPGGGPQTWTLSHTNFTAGDVCSVTILASQVADTDGTADNMAADYTWSFVIQGTSKIHAIQGSGSTVTVNSTFTVEAIVTGDYQGATGADDYKLDGFFIQEEDADADANAATSEGIFVYCATCPTNVVVGDKVQVTGTAYEYYNMSQLSATTAGAVVVISQNNSLPTPVALALPVPGVTATDLNGATAQIDAYYEQFEGMLVQFPTALSVTEYFELSRYGQVVLAQGGRFRQFTDANAPSAAGYTAHQIDLAKRKVILDDDSNQQNHALFENVPVFHPVPGFSITNYVRGGDTITDLTGVLHWSFAGLTGTDAWRIRPVMNASNAPVYPYTFTSGNPRGAAADVGGNIKVASFNVLNYFTTLNSRGAHSTAELDRQAAKIVAAFAGLGADVVGVMEIENNNDGAIADLVSRLNAGAGAGTYAYVATGTVGTDQITVGIIYKPAKVTPVGAVQTLTAAAFTDPYSTGSQRNRPAVAQTFEENIWGERFIVVVNHLKSKGSCPSSGIDTDQGDGQGCWNATRAAAAAYMVGTWIPTLATSSGDPDFLIVGDLNAYRKEAPITNIKNAGYADLLDTLLGAPAYGYVFDGQLGYLDHALSSATLTPQVSGATGWHINADEVNLLDYNDTVQDAGEQDFNVKPSATTLYEPNAYRSSDHDPVLVGLNLLPDLSELSAYGQAWHTGDGTWRLGSLWERGAGATDNDGVTRDYADSWNDTRGEVYVTVAGPAGQWACLNAWLDYSDGSVVPGTPDTPNNAFDANEHVINNLPIGPGANQLVTWPLEAGVINSAATYNMRFRLVPAPDPDVQSCAGVTLAAAAAPLAPAGGASPTGRADGGEVEDYSFDPGPLAVTLAAFTADAAGDGVTLAWETVSELDNAGFNIYRMAGGSVEDRPQPGDWLAFMPAGAPGSSQGGSYSYRDADVVPGATYWYWLEDVDLAGATTLHEPVAVTVGQPNAVGLAGFGATAAGPSLAGLAALALVALAGAGLRRRR